VPARDRLRRGVRVPEPAPVSSDELRVARYRGSVFLRSDLDEVWPKLVHALDSGRRPRGSRAQRRRSHPQVCTGKRFWPAHRPNSSAR